uniref:glucan endo-1,3-beta-D-glucosidase n=1 Tax=Araucaria cunninghamii TaxID=56994 RepID=A0A0D6R0H7_ARACU
MAAILLAFVLFLLSGTSNVWGVVVGINYGQIADNLPSPERVVGLLQSIGIKKAKLYDADPRVLKAFANSGIEFVVGLDNLYVANMTDPAKAVEWVKENVEAYLPGTNITSIAVGNEVYTGNDTELMENLVPAMQNVHAALVSLGLEGAINVLTAHSSGILGTSYPPSAGAFKPELSVFLSPLLDFHKQTGSPFLINAYPYFAYKADPNNIPLDYVLFQPNEGQVDSGSNLRYNNMLHAQIDSVYSAISALGYENIQVQVSETGWPSQGDSDEVGATFENAQIYNGNLLRLLAQNQGTPMRPSVSLDTYVFALFNENLKPGKTSERNYGLFKPDGTPAYDLGLHGSLSGSNTVSYAAAGAASKGTHYHMFFVPLCLQVLLLCICSFILGELLIY